MSGFLFPNDVAGVIPVGAGFINNRLFGSRGGQPADVAAPGEPPDVAAVFGTPIGASAAAAAPPGTFLVGPGIGGFSGFDFGPTGASGFDVGAVGSFGFGFTFPGEPENGNGVGTLGPIVSA